MSQFGGHADNHKAVEGLIPSSQWGEDILVDLELVKNNLLDIKQKIAPCKPKIIGVTKYFGTNAIVNGYKAGLRDFGESRALDAINKINSLPEEIRKGSNFHFIGHLQSNKAEKVVEYFNYIQSVDSLKLARVISQAACSLNKRENILLQVNLAEEEQKFGYSIDELRKNLPEMLKLENLNIVGLMCMAPLFAEEDVLRKVFSNLRNLRDELEKDFKIELPELSMGMSDDYDIATEEGATMIRIGRKLFK